MIISSIDILLFRLKAKIKDLRFKFIKILSGDSTVIINLEMKDGTIIVRNNKYTYMHNMRTSFPDKTQGVVMETRYD
jgi:hypothetical protein